MILGFTGTRHGMTAAQISAVEQYTMLRFDVVHHGDCVGADSDMHHIAKANGQQIIGHPPVDPRLRAWCECDVLLPEKSYLDRNRDIVDGCDELIATPAEPTEQDKGGTWYTVHYAESVGKPVIIVWPDGSIEVRRRPAAV